MRKYEGERGSRVSRETCFTCRTWNVRRLFVGTTMVSPGVYLDHWITTNTPEVFVAASTSTRTHEGIRDVGTGSDEVSRTEVRQQSLWDDEDDESSPSYPAPPEGEETEDEAYPEIQDEDAGGMTPEEFQAWLDDIDADENIPGFQTLDSTSTATTSPIKRSQESTSTSSLSPQAQRPSQERSSPSRSISRSRRPKLRKTRR